MKSPGKSLFQVGGPQGPGRGPAKGAPNAGRPPSAITLLAQEISERDRLLEIAAMIAKAEIQEVLVRDKKTGEPIVVDTKNSDRIAAIKLILAYAYGQAPQHVELSGDPDRPLWHANAAAELARKLDRLASRSQASAGEG